jgi:hypothetical protein
MFSTAATGGLCSQISSWKLDSSCTTISSAAILCRSASSGRPILPPTQVVRPSTCPMTPVRAVVVVLPAEPVIPITAVGLRRINSCESLVTSGHAAAPLATKGASAGTLPLIATTSAISNKRIGCSPNTYSICKSASSAISACKSAAGRKSETVTCAPTPTAKRASALPCRANPKINSRLPCNGSMFFIHP